MIRAWISCAEEDHYMRVMSANEHSKTTTPSTKLRWQTPDLRKADATTAEAAPSPSTDSGITTS
jgi:hypothetical protein